jgi:hypothetical protein
LKEALVGMKKNLTEIKKGVKQKIGMGERRGQNKKKNAFCVNTYDQGVGMGRYGGCEEVCVCVCVCVREKKLNREREKEQKIKKSEREREGMREGERKNYKRE